MLEGIVIINVLSGTEETERLVGLNEQIDEKHKQMLKDMRDGESGKDGR